MEFWTFWLLLLALPTIVVMVVSEGMARARGRSARTWVWIAAITGPLPVGPFALYLLGHRR